MKNKFINEKAILSINFFFYYFNNLKLDKFYLFFISFYISDLLVNYNYSVNKLKKIYILLFFPCFFILICKKIKNNEK